MGFADYFESGSKLFAGWEKDVMKSTHPYFPENVHLPGYQPLVIPFEQILTVFFGTSALLLLLVWTATGAQVFL
jgi:hypothetical protein